MDKNTAIVIILGFLVILIIGGGFVMVIENSQEQKDSCNYSGEKITDQNTLDEFCKVVEESKKGTAYNGTWINPNVKISNYVSGNVLMANMYEEELLKWKKGNCYNSVSVEFAFTSLLACEKALESCAQSQEQTKGGLKNE